MKATFISLPYGAHFRRPGDGSIYRKLIGTGFECVHPGAGRVQGFKAFDEVETVDAPRAVNLPAAAMALVRRVARLNPDAGEIGAGMLASLVQDARAIVGDDMDDATEANGGSPWL